MTTPDYRAALAELLAAVQSHLLFTDAETTTAERRARRVNDAMNAARALLAAPEAVEGTNGLHGKYIIHRSTDGSPVEFPCFVLRVDGKDPAAIAAIRAYSQDPTCPPELRNDIQIQFGWRQRWKDAAPEAVNETPSSPKFTAAEIKTANGTSEPHSSNGPTAMEIFQLWEVCNSPSVFARQVLANWGQRAPKVIEITDKEILLLAQQTHLLSFEATRYRPIPYVTEDQLITFSRALLSLCSGKKHSD